MIKTQILKHAIASEDLKITNKTKWAKKKNCHET